VCKAFGIRLDDNRADLCDREGGLLILPRRGRPRVVRGPRIGVEYSGKWAQEPLRFCDANSSHLSRPASAR
jgi:3-methyladenine DNA glycosylase Mpg